MQLFMYCHIANILSCRTNCLLNRCLSQRDQPKVVLFWFLLFLKQQKLNRKVTAIWHVFAERVSQQRGCLSSTLYRIAVFLQILILSSPISDLDDGEGGVGRSGRPGVSTATADRAIGTPADGARAAAIAAGAARAAQGQSPARPPPATRRLRLPQLVFRVLAGVPRVVPARHLPAREVILLWKLRNKR